MTDSEKLEEIRRLVLGPNAGLDEPDGGEPTAEEMLKNIQNRVAAVLNTRNSERIDNA